VVALSGSGPVAVFGLRADEPAPPPRPGIEVWRSGTDPAPTDPVGASALDWMKEPGAVPSDQYRSDRAAAELDALIDEFEPDVVVVADLVLHGYVDLVADRGLPVIADVHQVESVHNRHLAATEPSRVARLVRAELADRMAAVEARVLGRAAQVWTCSAEDADLLAATHHPTTPVQVVPNTVDVDSYWREGAASATVVFPAMFAYPPNEAAALVLAEEVLPPLAERFPDARLLLLGRNPTSRLLEAADADARVTVTGPVEDVRPHLAAAGAMAAPISGGGGTRLKFLEAFASRLPVASTAKGVEGLAARDGVHYRRAEDPAGFVDALTGLWTDPEATGPMVDRAHRLVQDRYSWAEAARCVEDALRNLDPCGRTP
jgi:glycosyltransferase involved in cell wall biosynthesis